MAENLNPFAKSRKPLWGVSGRCGLAGRCGVGGPALAQQKAPPGGAGLSWRSLAPGEGYLAGALDVSLEGFCEEDDELDFLCFL
jgi:hypothetical protein